MGFVESEGIVLKSYNLSEADKIVVFLTRQQGIIKGVAKGAKRLKSKFGASLEPFTNVQIQYFQKEEKELVAIRQIDLLKSYFDKTGEPLFLQKFSYLAELLLEFLPLNDPNEKVFRMVKVCLDSASTELAELESIILYFEIWLLKLNGYLPDWTFCFDCRRQLDERETANLRADFHLICANCRRTSGGSVLSGQQRTLVQISQTVAPDKFIAATRGQTNDVRGISAVLKKLIANLLGKEVTGERILIAGR